MVQNDLGFVVADIKQLCAGFNRQFTYLQNQCRQNGIHVMKMSHGYARHNSAWCFERI